jgi:hypothetical protein
VNESLRGTPVANSVELTTALAETFGKSPTSVMNQMRYLREAGIITKTGRGTSAARMTREDAVTLIAAVLGSDQINDSVDVAEKLLSLPALPAPVYKGEGRRFGTPVAHTFKDGLLRLFDLYDPVWLKEHWDLAGPVQETAPEMEVRVFYPRYSACILLRLVDLTTESWVYGRGQPAKSALRDELPRSRDVDLVQMRSISERTIERLSRVLAS